MERFELVKRNVQELVTEEQLRQLCDTKNRPSAYVGYEPSGKIHLGHVLTVNKLLDLQKAGFRVTVLLADLHAYLNQKGGFEEIREVAEYNRQCFIALGLSEVNTRYVLGSEFQLGEEYMLNVLRLARGTTLNRARRSMDEVSRDAENPYVSQMVYPLMQAVDIAMLDVDVAVGGIDQRKIHMLAREGLPSIGFKPPLCIHMPILLGLDGAKMSSSKGNYVSVDDAPDVIRRKINKAYCAEGVVEDNPVLQIFKYLIAPRYERLVVRRPEKFGGSVEYGDYLELERDFADRRLHPQDLKKSAADYLVEILEPVRELLQS
jgi:tyrosyl-tRNA synthetase